MSEIIKDTQVYLECSATTVDEVLDFLAAKAVEAGLADDKDKLVAAFQEREAQGTTGMVGGFAIPHAKSVTIHEPAVLAVKLDNVEWESMDHAPIKMAIALLMPDNEAGVAHLKTLSKVAVMLMNEQSRATLLDAADAASIAQVINDSITE